MVTIKDIAEKVGVSPTTVGNVLHGNFKKVSPETISKIQTAIKELNYIPNMGARLLAKNSSKIIGVVINYPCREEKTAIQDPFNAELIGSLENKIRENGYYTMVYTAQSSEEILNTVATWNFDGVVVLGIDPKEVKGLTKRANKPIVFIDCYFDDDNINSVNVGLDDFGGGYQMTNYLIENGHKKIAFLADENPPHGVDLARLRGYEAAMQEAGLGGYMEFIPFSKLQSHREKDLNHLISRIHDFTALFFDSDYYAVEAVDYFHDRNISVPNDISVVGFDDIYFATIVRPMLTTVRQDITEKGILSIQQLMNLIQYGYVNNPNIQLPIQIIERDSVKKSGELRLLSN